MPPKKKSLADYNAIGKRDLIGRIAERTSIPYAVVKFVYEAFWNELEDRLLEGSPVVLAGRGTFSFALRKYSPQMAAKDFIKGTEPVLRDEKYYTLKFTPAKSWRESMRERMGPPPEEQEDG